MRRVFLHSALACAALVLSSYVAHSGALAPLLLRDPSLSRTQIAFSYAGNIWIANRNGAELRRLTNGGHAAKPALSPDGSQVAFAGNYDGVRAVYIVPSAGGELRRLTYHPADLGREGAGPIPDVIAWTPDGSHVVFNSRREAFAGHVVQLFTIPIAGGFATRIPLFRDAQASFSADASRVAYVPNAQSHLAWKRYRGGQTTPILIADLADSHILATIPRANSNDFNPMWVGDTIYFLSDRNGPVTLFSYDVKSQQVKQVVKNEGLDIKSASASLDAIVYEQFGSLHLLDLKTGADHLLNIRPSADTAEAQPHFKKLEPDQIRWASLSPDGERATAGVHGDIVVATAKKGALQNLTHTVAAVERDPVWSPDGRSIGYFSDASGGYALHIANAKDGKSVRKVDLGLPPGRYYSPVWSPDSKKIAYADRHLNYWYVDLGKQIPVHVDADYYAGPGHKLQLSWSPDGRWIAYAKQLPSHLHAVFVYSIEKAKSYQLTDGRSDALNAAFDLEGQYLYFTASTDLALGAGWLDMTSMQRLVTRGVYRVALRDSLLPLETKELRVDIDVDGISERISRLPIPARNYYDLIVGRPGVLYLIEGPQVDPLEPTKFGEVAGVVTKVHTFDLKTEKSQELLSDVIAFADLDYYSPSFHLAYGGEKMLYAKPIQSSLIQWYIDSTDRSVAAPPNALQIDDPQIYVNPRAEWRHMFYQVLRGERDAFYDPNLHGLDVKAITKTYAPFLESISSRDDLNYLFDEVLGNLSTGHLWAFGGDQPHTHKPVAVGFLGADYSVDHERYRFARIYAGDPWSSDTRGPLTRSTAGVAVGEYLLAIDGRQIRPTADVYRFFEGTAGKAVTLTVGPTPDGADSHPVTVVPVADESLLRSYEWMENNRHTVDRLTGGRVAYVYLPDSFVRGYTNFNRDYFAQVGKSAVIIDQRYNGGGATADYIIDYLRRPLLHYWHMRDGKDFTSPMEAIFGPKVMLINEMVGSGGDNLAWMFRKAEIGPLVGKRTWGGLIGADIIDDLLDGGIVTAPTLAFYNPNGTWDIENHGVDPDIDVEEDPQAERQGRDPQLEKAVEIGLNLLGEHPAPAAPQHPPYPRYHLMPLR